MKLTKSKLKRLISEVMKEGPSDFDPEDAPSDFEGEEEETEEDIQASLEEAHAKLREALDIASRLDPGLALKIGPISDSMDKLLNPEEPEDDYEESLRRRYDKEEAAARREGPSTPMTPEESAALWADDDIEDIEW